MIDWQFLAAMTIVALSSIWMIRSLIRWARGSQSGCGTCSMKQHPPQAVKVKQLTQISISKKS